MILVKGKISDINTKNEDFPVLYIGHGRFPDSVTVKPDVAKELNIGDEVEIEVRERAVIRNDKSGAFINRWAV